MAREEALKSITLKAGADLSAKQYRVGALNASGDVVVAGAKARAVGIIQNNPKEGAVTVGINGVSRVVAGDAIPSCGPVQSDATGAVVPYTDGEIVGDVCETASAAGQIVSIILH